MSETQCNFLCSYPAPYWDWAPGCQFVEEQTFFPCDDKYYCRFHLPLATSDGKPTAKAQWAEAEHSAFCNEINKIIAVALDTGKAANLAGIVCSREISFNDRCLPETLWIGAQFHRNVLFQRVEFAGLSWFERASFSLFADFDDAKFLDMAVFKEAEFVSEGRFSRTQFKRAASFVGAKFWGCTFNRAHFADVGVFTDAIFHANTQFESAIFESHAMFWDAQFLGDSHFRSVVFGGNAYFSWFERGEPSNLSLADTHQARTPSQQGAFYELDFRGVRVKGTANFNNRAFQAEADFSDCVFAHPPKFHGTKLHQGTKWYRAKFGGTDNLDAEQDFRTLRLAMENIRDRPQEGVFFALEQRAMRRQAEWWELRRWLSLAYDLTCNYGRSPGRPLAWLGGVSIFFFLVYLALSSATWIDGPLLRELSVFTFRQLVKPFDLWGRGGELLMPAFTSGQPLLFKVVAAVQSILSFALLALFILALRWQFRRG